MATGGAPKRRPSQNEIAKMKVGEPREALKLSVAELKAYDDTETELEMANDSNDDSTEGGIRGTLKLILNELKAMREDRREIRQLRQDHDRLREMVMQQQRLMEQMLNKERDHNIIILGLPENSEMMEGAKTDEEKCGKILSKVGAENIQPVQIMRLGKVAPDKKRPTLVRLSTKEERNEVLSNARRLKEAGNVYKNVFIKKDLHLQFGSEWKRLKEVELTEKQKPENAGRNIEIDYGRRELHRDGVVIDCWNPIFFQPRR